MHKQIYTKCLSLLLVLAGAAGCGSNDTSKPAAIPKSAGRLTVDLLMETKDEALVRLIDNTLATNRPSEVMDPIFRTIVTKSKDNSLRENTLLLADILESFKEYSAPNWKDPTEQEKIKSLDVIAALVRDPRLPILAKELRAFDGNFVQTLSLTRRFIEILNATPIEPVLLYANEALLSLLEIDASVLREQLDNVLDIVQDKECMQALLTPANSISTFFMGFDFPLKFFATQCLGKSMTGYDVRKSMCYLLVPSACKSTAMWKIMEAHELVEGDLIAKALRAYRTLEKSTGGKTEFDVNLVDLTAPEKLEPIRQFLLFTADLFKEALTDEAIDGIIGIGQGLTMKEDGKFPLLKAFEAGEKNQPQKLTLDDIIKFLRDETNGPHATYSLLAKSIF